LRQFLLFCFLTLILFTNSLAQNQDCATATLVCSNSQLADNSNGEGVDEFPSGIDCLLVGENQSAWYILPIGQSGTLAFTIDPVAGSGEDYDFAVFGPNVDCNTLGNPIRCSYADDNCAFCPQTGLGNGTTDFSEPASGDGFVAEINAIAGEVYYLLVDNFNSSNSGFNLNFTGSAILDCCFGFAITTSSTDVSCNGGNDGTATVNTTNGTAPFFYAWSNGFATQSISGLTVGLYTVTVTDANNCTLTQSVFVSEPSVITLYATVTDVFCNGTASGFIDLNANGGANAFTYLWFNGETTQDIYNLSIGNYSVTVTDANGCTATLTTTVSEPSPLNISYTTVDVSCNGGNDGEINLTVSGGSPAYTFLWSNAETTEDISNLTAGTYDVEVTDSNFCDQTVSITINEPTAIIIVLYVTDVTCVGIDNGQIDTGISGGTLPYTYSWNNGSSFGSIYALSSGIYSLTVTDANGCTATATATVSDVSLPPVSLIADQTICYGQVLTLDAGVFASFIWSNGETTQSILAYGYLPGNFSVTVTDANGCTSTDDFFLTVLEVDVETGPDISISLGESVTLNTTVTPAGVYTYSWNPITGLDDPTSANPVATPTDTITYVVFITDDEFGCMDDDTITVNVQQEELFFIPNVFSPNNDGINDFFNVIHTSNMVVKKIMIYNRWGELIFDGSDNTGWDGSFKNEPSPMNTYVYQISIENIFGETQIATGDFLLMR